jgi:hypothetical protein
MLKIDIDEAKARELIWKVEHRKWMAKTPQSRGLLLLEPI